MKKGFSLIELLISLIIISLVAAAFAPVLTKKLKNQNSTLASGVTNCKKFDSSDSNKCLLCDKDKCELCSSSLHEKEGYFVVPNETCEYQKCSLKFDIACSRCTKDACLACKSGFNLINDKCEIADTSNFKREKNLYIALKNIGDGDVLKIKGFSAVATGTYCNANNQKCCWQGVTAAKCDNSGYSSCNRTVCNYLGAKEACSNLDYLGLKWRLAKNDEMFVFGNNPEFQFCVYDPKPSFKRCYNGVGTCNGSRSNHCRPNDYWTEDGNCAHSYYGNWNCGVNTQGVYIALSARCVADAR